MHGYQTGTAIPDGIRNIALRKHKRTQSGRVIQRHKRKRAGMAGSALLMLYIDIE